MASYIVSAIGVVCQAFVQPILAECELYFIFLYHDYLYVHVYIYIYNYVCYGCISLDTYTFYTELISSNFGIARMYIFVVMVILPFPEFGLGRFRASQFLRLLSSDFIASAQFSIELLHSVLIIKLGIYLETNVIPMLHKYNRT